jgi:hypothetical protein
MPIVGLNFKSINAKVDDKKITGNMEINSTPKIEFVEKREFKFAGISEAVIIGFSFKTSYQPDIAEISFSGEIVYQADDAKKMVKQWKESKKLEDDVSAETFNAIFRRCLTKAVSIADDLRLPPPLNFPVVTKKQEK